MVKSCQNWLPRMIERASTKSAVLTLVQLIVPCVLAWYAVEEGVPYVGMGPLPWWKSLLRWPWHFIIGLHPLVALSALFLVYSLAAFLVIRYLIVKPLLLRYRGPLLR
jgi:hypothetical protein